VKSIKANAVVLVGLGKGETEQREREAMRRGLAQTVLEVSRFGYKSVGVNLWDEEGSDKLARAVVESVELVSYKFTEHSRKIRREHSKRKIRQLALLVGPDQEKDVRRAVRQANHVMKGVKMARDLVNEPAGHMSPKRLVDVAKEISRGSDTVTTRILNKAQARRAGFTAFLAVAQGSKEEPYVIHLQYVPETEGKDRKKVWLIGKGITFDSGGLSLKPPEFMEDMKSDMGGAATVLGLFSIMGKLKLDVEVHGVVAACENMPSGEAYRPGDVLTAKNGKTIEVLNTDAEGRITLADALAYAAESKPDVIVDVATLTGACIVALGETVAGLWSTDKDLIRRISRAAKISGERIETMPMPEEYADNLISQVADVKNIGNSRFGGAIVAAMFLREFVGDVPWAHLDIAGPSYMSKRIVPYWDSGATGYGVRMLAELLSRYS